jgi:PAS domain S-box-containing protein
MVAIVFRARDRNRIQQQTKTLETEIGIRKSVEAELRIHEEQLELLVEKRTAQLLENERLLQGIMDHATAVIYVKDRRGRYVLVNNRFEKIFKLSRDEIIGKTDHDLFSREIADTFRANDLEVIGSRSAREWEENVIHEDGRLHTYVSLKFPLAHTEGDSILVCGISTDITARKKAEEMEKELQLAAQIQMDLLPDEPPALGDYDIAGRTLPAHSVGGDYFDFITVDESHVALCLGDVSGKGLPASLLMANTQATIRGQTLLQTEVGKVLTRSNALLYRSTDAERFVTLFYSILDTQQHLLSFSSAGHPPALLLTKEGECRQLSVGGIPLAMVEDIAFPEGSVSLAKNDIIVVYSDGVSEQMNPVGEQFGEIRLENVVRDHHDLGARDLIDRILEAARNHAGSTAQLDDMTVLVLKRKQHDFFSRS